MWRSLVLCGLPMVGEALRGGALAGRARASGRRRVAVAMSTTSARVRATSAGGFSSPKNSKRRGPTASERLVELAEEAVRVARETGPRAAVRRTVEGQRAIAATLAELASELPAPPAADEVGRWLVAGSAASAASQMVAWAQANVPEELAPRLVRRLFERLGATYVKLGQFVASSPTLFPAAFVKEFEKCLDQTPAVSFAEIRAVVERDLGRSLEATFDSFDETPLAAASIAQVHCAVYRGREVVVKVRKPGVEDLLKADLGFLKIASKALEAVAPELGRFSLADVVADLRESMLDELDFAKELANLQRFRAWLDETGLAAVATCPTPYAEVSAARTLVMDRLRGVAVTDLDALRAVVDDPETLLVNALNTWSASVLTNDFFHADVHAGNLLALPDGRVAFLDFGIVGRVPDDIWRAVADAAAAALDRDFPRLARALRDMGASDAAVDLDAFALDLRRCFDAFDAVQTTVVLGAPDADGRVSATLALDDNDDQVTNVLLSLVDAAQNNGVKLPREFGLLVKQALYFNRYTALLAPDIDVLQDDRLPYLRDATDRRPRVGPADDAPDPSQ